MTTHPVSDETERKFWGLHRFKQTWHSLGCVLCGWDYNDPIHTLLSVEEKENMDMKKAETEWMDQRRPAIQKLAEPQNQQKEENMHVPEEVKLANGLTESKEYPRQEGEFHVLGPGVFANGRGDIINWQGKNYRLIDPEAEGPRAHQVDLRRETLQAAVTLHGRLSPMLSEPSEIAEGITEMANQLYEWLNQK